MVAAKATVLRRLELDVTRRLDGLVSGDHRSASAGPGSERAGGRPYEPGDDARRIDWNLSARALVPHVRTTEADREQETWILVDRSPSMDFGTALHEKREVALGALAAFGVLSLGAGNRVGVLAAGPDRIRRFAATGSRQGVLAALSGVYDTPRGDAAPPIGARLEEGLLALRRTMRLRGRVVVISDFLEPSDWAGALRRLALRHEILTVHVTDPRELVLPPVGLLSVVDKETGRRLEVHTGSAVLRARYAAVAAQRDEAIRRAIRAAAAEHVRLSTDRDWLLDVARYVSGRRRTQQALPAPARGTA